MFEYGKWMSVYQANFSLAIDKGTQETHNLSWNLNNVMFV